MRTLLAFMIPPLAVYTRHGTTRPFYLNLFLTLLFYVPGVLHALHVTRRY